MKINREDNPESPDEYEVDAWLKSTSLIWLS